jgi:hypothetical protein
VPVRPGVDDQFTGEVAADPESAPAVADGRVGQDGPDGGVGDAGAVVADLAVQGAVVVPQAEPAGATTVADGVVGQFAGDDEQMLDLFVRGAEAAGVGRERGAQCV